MSDDGDPRQPLGQGFRRLWTSSGLSNLADGALKVALPLVAVRYTDSPSLIAGLAFALTLPWLLFALPAGALSDRLDRRRAMAAANVVRAGLMLAVTVAVLLDAGSIWLLYVVAFCVGTTETLYDTSAQSILPQLVPRPLLSRANGRLYAVELTANQFAGPPLGGFLVAAGAAAAFATPAGLWLVAVGALLLVRGRFRVERETRTTMRADIAEGLRFLWSNPVLRLLAAMVGTFNFASNMVFGVFVLYAVGPDSPMGLTDPEYGLLFTTLAVGALAGSLVAERVERRIGRQLSLALTVFGSTLMNGLPAVTADVWLLGTAFVLAGASTALWNVITVSLRQRITPDRLLGRLNSAYRLLAWGTMPLGALCGGLLAEWLGLRAVFAVAGVLTLGLLAGVAWLTEARMTSAELPAEPATAN